MHDVKLLLYRATEGCPLSEVKLYCHDPVGTTKFVLCREVKFTVSFIGGFTVVNYSNDLLLCTSYCIGGEGYTHCT